MSFPLIYMFPLDHTDLVCNIKRIEILAQPNIALLQSTWGDESIDLLTLNVIEFLNRSLDLTFVCLDIDNENKGVAILNQLHRRFSGQGVFDNRVLVQSILLWYTFAGILRVALQRKSLGSVEVNLGVDPCALL
mmetsp:Transcript_5774/g.10230  ORF Transcript_5774/g.10230 Transcript_5774/m.10230 type:complete len:134 (+) Transcript_5774:283-684(+)